MVRLKEVFYTSSIESTVVFERVKSFPRLSSSSSRTGSQSRSCMCKHFTSHPLNCFPSASDNFKGGSFYFIYLIVFSCPFSSAAKFRIVSTEVVRLEIASCEELRNMSEPFFHLSGPSPCSGHSPLHTPVSHHVLRCFQASSRGVLGNQSALLENRVLFWETRVL